MDVADWISKLPLHSVCGLFHVFKSQERQVEVEAMSNGTSDIAGEQAMTAISCPINVQWLHWAHTWDLET